VKDWRGAAVWNGRVVRFAVTPPPKKGPSREPFTVQLALSRVHPHLVALERTVGGYAPPREATRDWFDLQPKRGLAGYGLSRALRILLDVLSGLSALEDTRTEAGEPFVHGELVPAMLRVDRSGAALLIPLAPWHWSAPGTLPAPERSGHLAPERLLGDAIDARADVFSAGALLWEALAGRRLFEFDSVDSIVMRLMGGKVNLPQLPPELSWAIPLKSVAMRALSVDPEQRFANCAELAAAIEAACGAEVATHADVANYFEAPDRAARPSVIARPLRFPTHISSLSALVAPNAQHEPEASNSNESPVARAAVVPERRVSRSFWAIAATSCLISTLGLSAIARYHAPHEAKHSAALGAPSFAAPLQPDVMPPGSALTAPAAGPAASVESIPTSVEPVMLPTDSAVAPSKPQKGFKATKGLAPKAKPSAKPVRAPIKAAAKYGI
jgi:eukaryotic-like serine/threonine-protein kinase